MFLPKATSACPNAVWRRGVCWWFVGMALHDSGVIDGGLPEGATFTLSALPTGELNQSRPITGCFHIPVRVHSNERSYMLYSL